MYYVAYISGGIIWKTTPYMPLNDCITEKNRFNALPILDLERCGMIARVMGKGV